MAISRHPPPPPHRHRSPRHFLLLLVSSAFTGTTTSQVQHAAAVPVAPLVKSEEVLRQQQHGGDGIVASQQHQQQQGHLRRQRQLQHRELKDRDDIIDIDETSGKGAADGVDVDTGSPQNDGDEEKEKKVAQNDEEDKGGGGTGGKNERGKNESDQKTKKSRADKGGDLDWGELEDLTIATDEIATEQFTTASSSNAAFEIKTGHVSDTERTITGVFDDGCHLGGIKAIRADFGSDMKGVQVLYRSEGEGGWHGRGSIKMEYEVPNGQEIVEVYAREHANDFGMKRISFKTDGNSVIDIVANGSSGKGGPEKTFTAPPGYILGGIHGKVGGAYGRDPVTIGVCWVPRIYEAEEFTSKGDSQIAATISGYHGAGYMDFGNAGSYVEWNNVVAPSSGQYAMKIRYAAGDPNGRESNIIVGGENVGIAAFAYTGDSAGDWSNWADEMTDVSLDAGKNTVRIQSILDGPNVDYIQFAPYTTTPPPPPPPPSPTPPSPTPPSPTPPSNGGVTYTPGDFRQGRIENSIRLCRGLKSKVLAVTGKNVRYRDGRESSRVFHEAPDGAAVFERSDGSYAYVSNSEVGNASNKGKGGAASLIFDSDGKVISYRRVLSGTTRNCSGGTTPWGTFLSCEEYPGGRVWEVDAFGEKKWNGKSYHVTSMHLSNKGVSNPDNFEAVVCDYRNRGSPVFYLTVDVKRGALRRYKPKSGLAAAAQTSGNFTGVLMQSGSVSYLVLNPSDGTFRWSSNLATGERSALAHYNNLEGIEFDEHRATLYFVSKVQKELFALNLDTKKYRKHKTTGDGRIPGQPDQLKLIPTSDKNMLYFSEDGGMCGVYGRTRSGRLLKIVDTTIDKQSRCPMGETTGLAFSPDNKYMFFAAQKAGIVFQLWREDGRKFSGSFKTLKDDSDLAATASSVDLDGNTTYYSDESVSEWMTPTSADFEAWEF